MDQNISAAPDDIQETDKNDMNLNAPDSALLITGSGCEADKLLDCKITNQCTGSIPCRGSVLIKIQS